MCEYVRFMGLVIMKVLTVVSFMSVGNLTVMHGQCEHVLFTFLPDPAMFLGAASFSKGTVSYVVLFTYILILFLVFWENVLPGVPDDQRGLNIQDAYIDLHRVTLLLLLLLLNQL